MVLAGKNEETEQIEHEITTRAEEILKDLDLDIEYLKDKDILDLGAGRASLGEYLKSRDINCYSLDFERDDLKTYGSENRIIANAESLPIKSDSFDVVVSLLGVPMMGGLRGEMRMADEEDIEFFLKEVAQQISEIKRVLRNGGEFRIFPIDFQFLANQAFLETKDKPREIQIERFNQVTLESFEIYKQLGFGDAQMLNNKDGYPYLVWKKPTK